MPRGEKQINPFHDPLEVSCPDPSAARLSSRYVAAMTAKYKVAAELGDVDDAYVDVPMDTAAFEAIMHAIDPLP